MLKTTLDQINPFLNLMDEACRRFPHLNREEWLREAEAQLHENMTDKEVLQTIIRTTVEKTTAEEPDWQFVAAHLFAHELYMEAARNRGYPSAGRLWRILSTDTYLDGEKIIRCLFVDGCRKE